MTEITWQDRDEANYMPLLGGPKSSIATEAVARILTETIIPAMPKAPRPSSIEKHRTALGALVSDLLRFHAMGTGSKHAMSPAHFSSRELGFGRTMFVPIKDALEAHGLIDFRNGWNHTGPGFAAGSVVRSGGDVAFFRPTPLLLERLGTSAAEPWSDHWRAGKLKVPQEVPRLVLRAAKLPGEARGRELSFDPQGVLPALLLNDLMEANEYLASKAIDGIAFGGLRRIFNDGDIEGQRWKRGGRFYSLPGSEMYEMMDGEVRRSLIRFDGEPVAEVDISASHLTILYGVHGLPFDATKEDPYEVPNIRRAAVKGFVTTVLGRGAAEGNTWSQKARDDYETAHRGRNLTTDYRFSDVRAAVVRKHSFIHELSEDEVDTLNLQCHESDILRIAMASLRRNEDIPSLPVHDSLIVPASKVEETKAELTRAFWFHFESTDVVPRLSVKGLNLA